MLILRWRRGPVGFTWPVKDEVFDGQCLGLRESSRSAVDLAASRSTCTLESLSLSGSSVWSWGGWWWWRWWWWYVWWWWDGPCRPIGNPSSGLGRPQGSGHRAGFESVIKAFWVVLAMLIIPFATSGHGFCCTRSHRDWCCKNISLLFEGELLFAPRADVEGEGVEDVRVEVLLLHQLVHDVGHRGWRNPLPVIWIML